MVAKKAKTKKEFEGGQRRKKKWGRKGGSRVKVSTRPDGRRGVSEEPEKGKNEFGST